MFYYYRFLANIPLMITDSEKRVANFLNGYDQDKLKSLKIIVHVCEQVNDDLKNLANKIGIELISYNDFVEIGKKNLVQPNLVCNIIIIN